MYYLFRYLFNLTGFFPNILLVLMYNSESLFIFGIPFFICIPIYVIFIWYLPKYIFKIVKVFCMRDSLKSIKDVEHLDFKYSFEVFIIFTIVSAVTVLTPEFELLLLYLFIAPLLFTFGGVYHLNYYLLSFGYSLYYITTGEGVKIMVISKGKYRRPKKVVDIKLSRLSDRVFIERG